MEKELNKNNSCSEKEASFLEGKTVLFDLDGTLLDTFEAILLSMRYATQKVLGRVIPDEELIAKVGQPLLDQMETLADTPDQCEPLLEVYRAHNEQDIFEQSKPFEGILQMLDSLQAAGAQLGVVTSKRRELACQSLAYYELDKKFVCVIGSEDSEKHKPNPEPLLKAVEILGVKKSECFYVGDSPYDIQAANSAKIPNCAVTWGKFFSREELKKQSPTKIIDSPNELIVSLCEIM